jgi:hypothetical protein
MCAAATCGCCLKAIAIRLVPAMIQRAAIMVWELSVSYSLKLCRGISYACFM